MMSRGKRIGLDLDKQVRSKWYTLSHEEKVLVGKLLRIFWVRLKIEDVY